MPELLKKIKGNTYYVEGAVNSGVYVYGDGSCVVIDTGIDDDAGRKILKAVESRGLKVGMIINTHSHADHFGGNGFLIRRTEAEVLAPEIEAAIIANPYLEPFYLYSSHPPKVLQNKFLMGSKSRVDRFIDKGMLELGLQGVEIIDLKGHSPGQIGVATPDGVLFAADAYFSSSIVKKYRLPYFTNVKDTLDTLYRLNKMNYDYFLPSHGRCSSDPGGEIETNIRAIHDTIDLITGRLSEPMAREELAAAVAEEYNIKLNPNQHYLTLSAVSAYLSYMTDEGMLEMVLDGYRLKWKRA